MPSGRSQTNGNLASNQSNFNKAGQNLNYRSLGRSFKNKFLHANGPTSEISRETSEKAKSFVNQRKQMNE